MRRNSARAAMVIVAGAVAVLALRPAFARADVGDGLAVGPTRLHLGVEAGLGYDSMAGVGPFGANGAIVQSPGDGIATVRGLLDVEGKSDTFVLKLLGNLGWNQYLGFTADTQGLSYLGANVTGALQTHPDGPFGVDITESFTRGDRGSNPVFGLGVLTLNDSTKLRLRFRPGGGAIEFGIGGEFGADTYAPQIPTAQASNYGQCNGVPTCDPGLASAYNGFLLRGTLDAKWRFLPKTGVTLDASFGEYLYQYGAGTPSYALVPNLNALPYQVLVGFGTLLSTRFSFSIKGGYQGITFQQNVQDNTGTWAGQADVGFLFSESSSTRLGYVRGISPVGGLDHWFGDDRIFWELTMQPTSKLLLYALASADFISYGGTSRSDSVYSVGGRAEYAFIRWLKLVGRIDYSSRSSQGADSALNDPSSAAYNYSRFGISLGLSALF